MVTDFDRISVEGPYRVSVVTTRSTSAKASGSGPALDSVDIFVLGKSLVIRPKRSVWGERGNAVQQALAIRVTTPQLRMASLGGAGSLSVQGMKNLKVDLFLNGTGQLSVLDIAADRLAVTIKGTGQALLGGKAGNLLADVAGASGLDGKALKVMDAQLTAQTSGSVDLDVTRQAKIVSTGAGLVTITGRPACDVNNVGSGSVQCGPVKAH